MAHLLTMATEQAGESAGPRLSSLLNATFGNAAEIFIVVLAIREGGELIDVARTRSSAPCSATCCYLRRVAAGAGLRHGTR